ncbi:MAG: hypothetical protein HXY34_01210 [Candidatus Thorarchaeota archaeon]|nr:hypothetical protein [Candidatus Thorarchaeota archaeon]
MTRKIRVCPRCGSTKISEAKTSLSGWLVPATYFCSDCHYSGMVYVEIDAEDLDKLQSTINGD